MLGQNKILSYLDNSTLNTFPQSLILVGEKGCGKHLYCKEVSNKFNIDLLDITDKLNLECISDLYINPKPYLYLIDTSKISIKEQNIILKFIEEPPENSLIVLLCEDLNYLLPTIKNRCVKWIFEPYSKEDLRVFIKDQEDISLLDLFETPGQLLEIQKLNIYPYKELASKILEKINIASIPNTLTISNNIGFKDEKDKLNLFIFQKILLREAFNNFLNSSDISKYEIINNYINYSKIPKIDQKILFDNFLIGLWEASRNGVNKA